MTRRAVTPDHYPGILYTLASAGMIEAAEMLIAVRGGTTVVIPRPGRAEGSQLEGIVGAVAAELLSETYGPCESYVPLAIGQGAKMRAIYDHPSGSPRAIARDLRISESWVRRVLNDRRKPQVLAERERERARQLPLFDSDDQG